jgi:hypothetical protein
MKKHFILLMVFTLALTACDALALPTQSTQPTVVAPTVIVPTAQVIVVTVEIPVVVTATSGAASPTPVPTDTQPPTAASSETPSAETTVTEAVSTQATPTETAPAASAASAGPVNVDASLLGGSFKDITYSSPSFSLRCAPTELTINATASDPSIVEVDFYYRIEDRKGTTITEWKNVGKMKPTGNGGFTITMRGDAIHPDWRKALAWFDFQLVGLNQQGAAVGRTGKIVQLVTYTIDCQ